MSNALDDKLARALALALALKPRANLQQIAKSAGISKATLYRIAPTREAIIEMLLKRSTKHLQEALAKADLDKPPFVDALSRLTANIIQRSEYYLFWTTIQFLDIISANESLASTPMFYEPALEDFFYRGQRAGAFRIDLPTKWLVRNYDFQLFAAIDSAQRGEIGRLELETLVTKTFFHGTLEPSPNFTG